MWGRGRTGQCLAMVWGFALLLGLVSASRAQVAVYQLHFEDEKHAVNFEFFDGGYFVMNGMTGLGSFVFTYAGEKDGLRQPYYLLAENTGQSFMASDVDNHEVVIRAESRTATAISHYLAMGQLDDTIFLEVDGETTSFDVASVLRGYVLASDDESDVDYAGGGQTIGFAGYSALQFELVRSLTDEVNAAGLTPEEALMLIAARLERDGFLKDNPAAVAQQQGGLDR